MEMDKQSKAVAELEKTLVAVANKSSLGGGIDQKKMIESINQYNTKNPALFFKE